MTPRVSIVMPVSNSERFVSETLDSLLGQTLTDFECIVVDNGSTDRTPAILAEYAARDPRIKLLRNEQNLGPSAARNAGCGVARASLIAVMDHDDIALPDRLQKQVDYLDRHPEVAAVGGAVRIIDGTGNLGSIRSFPTVPGLAAWSMLFFSSMAHPTVLMRADAFRAIGGYSPDIIAADDYELLMRMSCRARLANLPDVVLLYRWWGGNTTTVRGREQEAEANMIVQTNIRNFGGLDVSLDDAQALRGLARDDYPKGTEDVARIAGIIDALLPVYLQRVARTAEDRREILRDAGMRFWMLGALSGREAPRLAARLVARATRLSPQSGFAFAGRAGRRLLSNLGMA